MASGHISTLEDKELQKNAVHEGVIMCQGTASPLLDISVSIFCPQLGFPIRTVPQEGPDFRISRYPDFRKSGYPDVRISGLPDIRKSRNPDIRISGFPDIRFSKFPEIRKFDTCLRASSDALMAFCHVAFSPHAYLEQNWTSYRLIVDLRTTI